VGRLKEPAGQIRCLTKDERVKRLQKKSISSKD
jgi:hypothetical protein